LSRAQTTWLHVEPTRARFGALQRDLGPRRRVLRRTPPHSGEPAATSRLHASWIVGSLIYDANQIKGIPLRCSPPWTRASGARRGSPHRRAPTAVGSETHGAAVAFSLKGPEQFYFYMPVLPPYRNLAFRSWFLQTSSSLPRLIVLEVLFLCFSTLALLFLYEIIF
jgi:hypothetical protein